MQHATAGRRQQATASCWEQQVAGSSNSKLQQLLDKYRCGERKAAHLAERDVRLLLDRHYPTDACKKHGFFLDKSADAADEEVEDKKVKKAYLKSTGSKASDHAFSVIAVTLAMGRQLLLEHARL